MSEENMNKEDVSAVVKETLIQLGIDIKDPIGYQNDMAYLRTLRTNTERVKTAGWVSAFMMLLGIIYTAFKSHGS